MLRQVLLSHNGQLSAGLPGRLHPAQLRSRLPDQSLLWAGRPSFRPRGLQFQPIRKLCHPAQWQLPTHPLRESPSLLNPSVTWSQLADNLPRAKVEASCTLCCCAILPRVRLLSVPHITSGVACSIFIVIFQHIESQSNTASAVSGGGPVPAPRNAASHHHQLLELFGTAL